MPSLLATALLATLALGQEKQAQKPATAAEIHCAELHRMLVEEALSIQHEKMQCYSKQAANWARVKELEAKLDKLDPHWRERK